MTKKIKRLRVSLESVVKPKWDSDLNRIATMSRYMLAVNDFERKLQKEGIVKTRDEIRINKRTVEYRSGGMSCSGLYKPSKLTATFSGDTALCKNIKEFLK